MNTHLRAQNIFTAVITSRMNVEMYVFTFQYIKRLVQRLDWWPPSWRPEAVMTWISRVAPAQITSRSHPSSPAHPLLDNNPEASASLSYIAIRSQHEVYEKLVTSYLRIIMTFHCYTLKKNCKSENWGRRAFPLSPRSVGGKTGRPANRDPFTIPDLDTRQRSWSMPVSRTSPFHSRNLVVLTCMLGLAIPRPLT